MGYTLASIRGLPVLAACVFAAASYPAKPVDLTTPVQQRIAIKGPNGEHKGLCRDMTGRNTTTDSFPSRIDRLEHISTTHAAMRPVWHVE